MGTLHRVSAKAEIGVSGLATMGRNLARNLARHGHVVAVHNRSAQRTRDLVENFSDEGTFVASESAQEFVDALERPRRIVLMVPAGAATDAVIDEFTPLLEQGDVIIDAGNAHFLDTRRREKALSEKGLNFVGMGVSGGEEGALNGPSIMPGGPKDAYDALGPLLEDIAAKVDGEPCCTHIGADGAGHFVKMVHNGIEYADMQLISESYDLLRSVLTREILPRAEAQKRLLAARVVVIGAGGLGYVAVTYGYQRFDQGVMVATIIVLIVTVAVIQVAGDALARSLNPVTSRRVNH